MSQSAVFVGFASPTTTPVPDQLFDELLTMLSGNQIKVLLYIIRRTYGFKKSSDTISLNQMLHGLKRKDGRVLDRGVGLSKPTLLTTLKTLVTKGIVMRQRRQDAKRGHLPTCYSLKLAAPQPETKTNRAVEPAQRAGETPGQKSLSRPGQRSSPTTTNRLTREKINVVKKSTENNTPGKPRGQVDYLVDEIERHTGDQHSRGNFAQIASVMADHKLFQLLSEMKQTPRIRNRGAWFTAAARQHAPLKQQRVPERHDRAQTGENVSQAVVTAEPSQQADLRRMGRLAGERRIHTGIKKAGSIFPGGGQPPPQMPV